jgi:hypothetical protein
MKLVTTLTWCVLLSTHAFAQQLVTVCAASKGWTYYVRGQEKKWVEDGISKGAITLIRDSNGKYDLLVTDVLNSYSVTEDGAKVAVLYQIPNPPTIMIVVAYPHGTTESYMFLLDKAAKGEVIWSSLKPEASSLIPGMNKGSLFRAECKK